MVGNRRGKNWLTEKLVLVALFEGGKRPAHGVAERQTGGDVDVQSIHDKARSFSSSDEFFTIFLLAVLHACVRACMRACVRAAVLCLIVGIWGPPTDVPGTGNYLGRNYLGRN